MSIIRIPTNYYQHFDADFGKDVPAEGYGGWKKELLPINTERTALAVMHAWDCGTREQYPGWHRTVEYIPRSYEILRTEFPKILNAVRKAKMNVVHIVSGESYCKDYPGYKKVKELEEKHREKELLNYNNKLNDSLSIQNIKDETLEELYKFRHANVFPGEHNVSDIKTGQSKMTFAKEAQPINDEAIAKDSAQLYAYCKENQINHLIYIGFAIDGCLLVSPGGMVDMSRKGILCSTIKQAVTAIENKETARNEICKQVALWRVALLFGFVYDSDEFVDSILNEIDKK